MSVPPARPTRRLTGAQILLIVVVSVLVLLLAVLLVQRASSDGAGATAGQESPPPAAGPSEDGAATDPQDPTATDEPEEVTSPEPPETEPTYFASPSGNIACEITVDSADCVIATFGYDADDAADCEREDAGGHLRVEEAGASLPCEPLVVAGDVPGLPYGESVSAHGFTCDSEESGITCQHDDAGYGFSVARAAYDLF